MSKSTVAFVVAVLVQVHVPASALTDKGVDATTPRASSLFSCQVPSSPGGNGQSDFDAFSWRTFSALNLPNALNPTAPACESAIGTDADTVWRNFVDVNEVFDCPGRTHLNTTFSGISKVSPIAQKQLGGIMQPVAGWLSDRFGNPTYYQIAVNDISKEYVCANGLTTQAALAARSSNIVFPDGATEIKASWRILDATCDDPSRYLSTSAMVNVYRFDPSTQKVVDTGTTRNAKLGLVGLHVIVKSPGFPQWIWSTFEHVDNVTPHEISASEYQTKVDAGCTNVSMVDGRYMQVASYADTPAEHLNVSPLKYVHDEAGFTQPTPVSRVTPILASTAKLNAQAIADGMGISGSFIPYYELVRAQWPEDPDDPGNPAGTPSPAVSANTTMESYIQPTSSCMDCHSTAVLRPGIKADYSFIFLHAP